MCDERLLDRSPGPRASQGQDQVMICLGHSRLWCVNRRARRISQQMDGDPRSMEDGEDLMIDIHLASNFNFIQHQRHQLVTSREVNDVPRRPKSVRQERARREINLPERTRNILRSVSLPRAYFRPISRDSSK
jgi:hypothetical protein